VNRVFLLLRRFFARWRAIHWLALAVVVLVCSCVGVVLVRLTAAFSGGPPHDLSDFGTAAEARAFVSAHLPMALPGDAVVEKLAYERWTDWHLAVRVRLPSAWAADRYLEQARAARKVNDGYCTDAEPPRGARYFLAEVSACGSIARMSPQILEVVCYTR
jgi:hypothetical protein